MTTQANKRTAKWMGDQYVVTATGTENEWFSTDGDNWVNQDGKPVADETFEDSTIVLCGGPRDGETVA